MELVGRAGEDPEGDALLIALAHAGVGHIALLRDPYRPTRLVAGTTPAEAEADDEPVSLLDDDGAPVAPAVAPAPSPDLGASRWPVLEPADVDLGLRYIPSYAVIVVTDEVPAGVVAVAAEAAAYAAAALVVLVGEGSAAPDGVPSTATVLEAPADDPGGAFAAVVAGYAVALDGGATPEAAFRAAITGWESPAP